MRRGRLPRSLVAVGLVAAFLSAPTTAHSIPCAAGIMEQLYPITLHVKIGKFNKTYRVGDKVKVEVLVTRPAGQDPAGFGITHPRPASVPAEEVNLGVGISIGRDFLPGYGYTNQKGRATVPVKIERYIKPGSASVRVYATKQRVNTTCLTVEEAGFGDVANAFRVKS
jgi:hypothetical protein